MRQLSWCRPGTQLLEQSSRDRRRAGGELTRTTSVTAAAGAEPTWRTLKVAVAGEELTVTRTVCGGGRQKLVAAALDAPSSAALDTPRSAARHAPRSLPTSPSQARNQPTLLTKPLPVAMKGLAGHQRGVRRGSTVAWSPARSSSRLHCRQPCSFNVGPTWQ
jgi:hypothetical protein